MQDVELVESMKTHDDLNESAPYFIFREARMILLVLADLLEEIAIVRKLHY